MQLETERLILRPYAMSDAEDVHVHASDPEVCRGAEFGPNSWEDTLEFLRHATDPDNTSIELAIVLKETGQVVGGIGVRPPEDGCHELGWVLRRSLWGQGIVPEAARALADHVRLLDGAAMLRARCRPDNPASARVMEKIGMRFVRRIERDREVRGEWVDSLLYEMDAGEADSVPA